MKATDLMIGDLITFKVCLGDTIIPIKVVELCETYSFLGKIGGDNACDYLEFEEIVGIPLTPEILEKNGFKKAESDTLSQTWAWAEKSEKIYGRWAQITFYNEPINGVSYLTKIETCSSKGDGVNHLHSCDIESVHELQHALHLCGINKEIQI